MKTLIALLLFITGAIAQNVAPPTIPAGAVPVVFVTGNGSSLTGYVIFPTTIPGDFTVGGTLTAKVVATNGPDPTLITMKVLANAPTTLPPPGSNSFYMMANGLSCQNSNGTPCKTTVGGNFHPGKPTCTFIFNPDGTLQSANQC